MVLEQRFWTDMKGSNVRTWITNIDVGYYEAWATWVCWEDDQVIITTQYEPPMMCSEDPCLHLPQRCHWDMYEFSLEDVA
jgi:hypothetical protein